MFARTASFFLPFLYLSPNFAGKTRKKFKQFYQTNGIKMQVKQILFSLGISRWGNSEAECWQRNSCCVHMDCMDLKSPKMKEEELFWFPLRILVKTEEILGNLQGKAVGTSQSQICVYKLVWRYHGGCIFLYTLKYKTQQH